MHSPHHMLQLLGRLAIIAVGLYASPAFAAAPPDGLYEATVPIAEKTEAARNDGVRNAMAQVLIKLTGDRGSIQRQEAQSLLRDAQRYVREIRFEDIAAPGTDKTQPNLWVQFDPAALGPALAGTGLPLWGQDRPGVLIWLALEEGGAAALISPDDDRGYTELIRRQMSRRGLSSISPLLDLEDQNKVSAGTLKQEQAAPLRDASARYGTGAVVSAVLSHGDNGLWTGRFVLYFNGQNLSWSVKGQNAEEIAAQGADDIADAIAVRYARATPAETGPGQTVELIVEGVRSLQNYADLQRYLRSLNAVTAVNVSRVEGDRVTLVLGTKAGLQAIADSIAYNATLQPAANGAPGHYRLIP
ncbi:MAG TPA: DUF2066 domain-containing protein [Gammaproteobacteria bacterium]|nr:DUF2066 domain-containing protein [Gammaproteobacteria bacterium]